MKERHRHLKRRDATAVGLTLGTPDAERKIAGLVPVTATIYGYGRSLLALPESLDGVRILDIGAGASDITARFIELGAVAYAVDPRYRSRSDLKGKAREQ